MLKEKTIGLNETKLGLVAPPWFISTMMNVIGRRQTELALTSGRMFTTEEASKIGLIDEIAENSEEAMIKCRAFLQLFEKISPSARAATKNMIRKKTIQVNVFAILFHMINCETLSISYLNICNHKYNFHFNILGSGEK